MKYWIFLVLLFADVAHAGDKDQLDAEVSREPVFVKSNNLQLDAAKRVFAYKGNVEITQGDLILTSDAVLGKYDNNQELESLICDDNVVITKGLDLRASANRARYDVAKGVIELTEAPELFRQGNVLTADKILIYVNEDRSEAQGEVRVKVLQTEGQGLGDLKAAAE